MMKRQFLLFILLFLISASAMAQLRHELSINGGGGFSTLHYTYPGTDYSMGLGGKFGLGYHLSFSPQWSVRSGLEMAFYNAETTASSLSNTNLMTSDLDANLDFTYTYTGYKEHVSATFLSIPLMMEFQLQPTSSFYAAMGVKIAIPITASAKETGTLSTTAYSPTLNIPYSDEPSLGLYTNRKVDEKAEPKFNTVFMLAAEAGYKWNLAERWGLYTGVYFDWSINQIGQNAAQNTIVSYTPSTPAHLAYSSLVDMAETVRPWSLGITVRFNYRLK